MAKSLRSKWRRKMRNIKRERYGKKELIKLKKMLGLPTDEDKPGADVEMNGSTEPEDVITAKERRRIHSMVREGSDREDSDAEKEIEEVIVLTTSRKLRQSYRLKKQKEAEIKEALEKKEQDEIVKDTAVVAIKPTSVEMEHDQKRVYNGKTMRDQYGNYPIWMNQKKMRTLARENRKIKKKMKKRLEKSANYRSVRDEKRKAENSESAGDDEDDDDVQEVSMESMEVETK